MGCGTPQEKIEDQMMAYKLERMDVQMQKEKELKKLAEIEGHVIERGHVPDYIDPEFAKKNNIYIDNIDKINIKNDKKKISITDINEKRKKNSKDNKDKKKDKKSKFKNTSKSVKKDKTEKKIKKDKKNKSLTKSKEKK